jgi:hypothetical protein
MKQALIGSLVFLLILIGSASRIKCQSVGWTRAKFVTGDLTVFEQPYAFVSHDSIVFAASYSGVMKSTDHGETWLMVKRGQFANHYYSVYTNHIALIDSVVFVDSAQTIFRSTDFGSTWLNLNNGLPNTWINSLAINGQSVFAGTDAGLFINNVQGNTWRRIDNGLPHMPCSVIGGNGLVFVITDSGIFRSLDNGNQWTKVDSSLKGRFWDIIMLGSDLFSIFMPPNGPKYSYRSSDSGRSWMVIDSNYHRFAVGGANLFSCELDTGPIELSTDNGSNWKWIGSGHRTSALGATKKNVFWGSNNVGIYYRAISDILNSLTVREKDASNDNILFSPNPTTGIITLHNAPAKLVAVSVLNVLGQTVLELPHHNTPDFTFDLSKLPSGMYFARFVSAESTITRKILKE